MFLIIHICLAFLCWYICAKNLFEVSFYRAAVWAWTNISPYVLKSRKMSSFTCERVTYASSWTDMYRKCSGWALATSTPSLLLWTTIARAQSNSTTLTSYAPSLIVVFDMNNVWGVYGSVGWIYYRRETWRDFEALLSVCCLKIVIFSQDRFTNVFCIPMKSDFSMIAWI